MNPAQPFLDICKTDPERLAIVAIGGKSITRQGLERRVYALANHLRNSGNEQRRSGPRTNSLA